MVPKLSRNLLAAAWVFGFAFVVNPTFACGKAVPHRGILRVISHCAYTSRCYGVEVAGAPQPGGAGATGALSVNQNLAVRTRGTDQEKRARAATHQMWKQSSSTLVCRNASSCVAAAAVLAASASSSCTWSCSHTHTHIWPSSGGVHACVARLQTVRRSPARGPNSQDSAAHTTSMYT